ncbi:MAG: T9SS type A sorting domain-containing protein [Ignavibacteriales bacterium]|nr:T9SS type A sorting domain-containing protein [Ignavibacteriales bacterium]MCB9218285.1 T9SS type A sorting domain-containing protein [Ignavibacteriales bacterium]
MRLEFSSIRVLFIVFLISLQISAQKYQWKVFTNDEIGISNTRIQSIVEDKEGVIWIGTTEEGLLKFENNVWTKYDTSNSPLPVNLIWTVKVDSENNKWIGTFGSKGGLIRLNDTNWTVYYLNDYGNSVFDIDFDKDGNLWMGSYWYGLIKFSENNFQVFNSSNTNLEPNMEEINCLEIDHSGEIWVGSDGVGVAKFDGVEEWTHYYATDSTVDNAIYTLDIDEDNTKWFGGTQFLSKFDNNGKWTIFNYPTNKSWPMASILENKNEIWFSLFFGGFYKFENGTWTHIYPTEPDLSDQNSNACYKDKNGNIWIGYNNGYVAIYNENGIVKVEDNNPSIVENNFILEQNYPNPFNPVTTIKYSVPNVETHSHASVRLIIYDILGSEIQTLVNKLQKPGNYQVEWNASGFPSGIYFYKLTAGNFSEMKKMILLK